MIKRLAASLALSLGMLLAANPVMAQIIHCTGCTYEGTFIDRNGDAWLVFTCDECHEDVLA
ncbi:MAG TPA: hypothetical protein VHG91_06430 [Longimicrobium sp.]|nr:hypothetical protein [Longimicrobium sp.]